VYVRLPPLPACGAASDTTLEWGDDSSGGETASTLEWEDIPHGGGGGGGGGGDIGGESDSSVEWTDNPDGEFVGGDSDEEMDTVAAAAATLLNKFV
jgi:hypothetical protein